MEGETSGITPVSMIYDPVPGYSTGNPHHLRITICHSGYSDTTDASHCFVDTNSEEGLVTYRVDQAKIKAVIWTVSFELSYGDNKDIYYQRRGVVSVRKYSEIRVTGIDKEELNDRIRLIWSSLGMEDNEKPLYAVSIWTLENGHQLTQQEHTYTNSYELEIKKRPWKFQVDVLPVLSDYTGTSLNLTIDLPEKVPNIAPTDIEVFPEHHDKVRIDFVPIPNIHLFGRDLGCKVEICEKQETSPTCLVKIAPPRARSAEFNDLKASKIYYVGVACTTGAGIEVAWIAFKNVAERTTTTTTKKLKTSTAPSMISPGYKFDLSCYIYAVNVTLQNGKHIYERTEEKCYNLHSPSFLMIYFIVLFAVIIVVACVLASKKKRRRVSGTTGGKKGSAETKTDVLSGDMKTGTLRTEKKNLDARR
ncbi:hypothetical protein RB195_015170 [Necator americanus]|uniref:Fibronectin type-III domain-containing protein n=1 Tax=Necator americanus TaxID=51031 RepID=A0ABR1E3B4_NECAM